MNCTNLGIFDLVIEKYFLLIKSIKGIHVKWYSEIVNWNTFNTFGFVGEIFGVTLYIVVLFIIYLDSLYLTIAMSGMNYI